MASIEPVNSKHLISIHHPKLWVLSGIGVCAVVMLFIWSAYEYGRFVAGFDQSDSSQEIELLRSALDEQTARKETALRDNARLSRGSDIQKDASGQISETLASCEADVLKMKEELTFYHNVVAPKKSKREIQVNKVTLFPQDDGSFNYKVVLIQVGRHDYLQRGYVAISFVGKQANGSDVRLDLSKVTLDKKPKRQKFGFKYFQNFEGGIRFPDGFEPLSIHIKAQPKSARVPKVDTKYVWADLIARGNETNVGQE